MNLWAVPAIASAAYQLLALFAGLRKNVRKRAAGPFTPPVSILKPVNGVDESLARAIASHARQAYPEFEIIFGIASVEDPAKAAIEALIQEYPHVPIRLIIAATDAPNVKVGVLEHLAAAARYPYLLVNDSDILVDPAYVQNVMAVLADERIGLVTCLYRGHGGSMPARFEALGIATEFAPSVLLARLLGINEFAMGSTLAFRASDLESAGGFTGIRDFLADDYQLGKRLTEHGKRVELGLPVVDTWLGQTGWMGMWKHQLRWSRTIRVSRPGGYCGYAITFTLIWSLAVAAAGNLVLALICYALRTLCALWITGWVLRDRKSLARFWWLPARDLFGFAVWATAMAGNTVEWRGKRFQIDRLGRLTPLPYR